MTKSIGHWGLGVTSGANTAVGVSGVTVSAPARTWPARLQEIV